MNDKRQSLQNMFERLDFSNCVLSAIRLSEPDPSTSDAVGVAIALMSLQLMLSNRLLFKKYYRAARAEYLEVHGAGPHPEGEMQGEIRDRIQWGDFFREFLPELHAKGEMLSGGCRRKDRLNKGYYRYYSQDENDCYTAIFSTRAEVRERILQGLKNDDKTFLQGLMHLLCPAVQSRLREEGFVTYLKKHHVIEEVITHEQIKKASRDYANRLEVIKAYLDYDLQDRATKVVDYSHVMILHVLSYLDHRGKGTYIHIWTLGENEKLIPYPPGTEYVPEGPYRSGLWDLLIDRENRLHKLHIEGDVFGDIYPLDYSRDEDTFIRAWFGCLFEIYFAFEDADRVDLFGAHYDIVRPGGLFDFWSATSVAFRGERDQKIKDEHQRRRYNFDDLCLQEGTLYDFVVCRGTQPSDEDILDGKIKAFDHLIREHQPTQKPVCLYEENNELICTFIDVAENGDRSVRRVVIPRSFDEIDQNGSLYEQTLNRIRDNEFCGSQSYDAEDWVGRFTRSQGYPILKDPEHPECIDQDKAVAARIRGLINPEGYKTLQSSARNLYTYAKWERRASIMGAVSLALSIVLPIVIKYTLPMLLVGTLGGPIGMVAMALAGVGILIPVITFLTIGCYFQPREERRLASNPLFQSLPEGETVPERFNEFMKNPEDKSKPTLTTEQRRVSDLKLLHLFSNRLNRDIDAEEGVDSLRANTQVLSPA